MSYVVNHLQAEFPAQMLTAGRKVDFVVILEYIADDKVAQIGLFVHKKLQIDL